MNKSNQKKEEILPIEKQKIKGKFKHVILTIPALDEKWLSNRSFGYYIFPPNKQRNGKYDENAKEEWLKMMSFVLDDIWWLCELPYHKFWSQVIFDKEAMNGIRSFLHLALLQKLYFRVEDSEILGIYKRIKKAIFQFLKRLTRIKESTLHFMSEEKYEEIMTNTNLISISLIFCICSVYGKQDEVEKMISDVFKYNKSLKLDEAVLRTTQLFSWLDRKIKNGYKDLKRSIEYIECDQLNELFMAYRNCLVTAIQCLTNAALSVSNFISVYQSGCEVFTNYDFEYHIIRTYKKLIIPLYEEVNLVFSDSCFKETRSRLISMIDICRMEFLKIFYTCVQSFLKKLNNSRECFDVIHNFVKLLKFSLKVEEFLFEFNDTYSIEEITKAINKNKLNIDLTEVDRVKELIIELYEKLKNDRNNSKDSQNLNNVLSDNLNELKLDDSPEMSQIVEKYCIDFDFFSDNGDSDVESVDSKNSKALTEDDASSEYSDWTKNDGSDLEYDGYLTNEESESTEISDSRRESKDFLDQGPNYSLYDQPGPSGITSQNSVSQRCQPEMEIAIGQVKDVLPHLGDGFIVMCLEYYKLDASAVVNAILENNLPPSLTSIDHTLPFIPPELLENSNHADVANEHLTELRKIEYSSYTEMLNDKTEIENFKNIYEKYQIVSHDLYDDDAEEDYEEDIAAIEADPEGMYDTFQNTPFNLLNEDFDEDDIEIPNENQNIKNPLNFCENPEEIRARAEQRRRTKDEKYNQSRKNQKYQNTEKDKDQTNRDRHHKNVYKSRSANHNRRYLSDRKRRV